MSPSTCSHSGFSARLSVSICGERSDSVHVKCSLQVRGVVAAARAQLEQRLRVGHGLDDQRSVPRGLDRVVLGRGEQVEPGREIAVEAHAAHYPDAAKTTTRGVLERARAERG